MKVTLAYIFVRPVVRYGTRTGRINIATRFGKLNGMDRVVYHRTIG